MEIQIAPDGTQTLVASNGTTREIKPGEDQAAAAAEFAAQHGEPEPVPASVTPLQMRKALRQMGLKAAVDAYIATLDEATTEEWEYALAIERGNPTLQTAISGTGWTEEQADNLFRLAGSL